MNPEQYPIGVTYGLKPSERLKEQRRLSRKYQPAMNEGIRAFGEHVNKTLIEMVESEPKLKKWKPVLPAWKWSGLSLARFVKYCYLTDDDFIVRIWAKKAYEGLTE